MQQLPVELVASFEQRLDSARVPASLRPGYLNWLQFYFYFCKEFGFPATAPNALGPFLTKLAETNHSIDQRHHAATAVRLLLKHAPEDRNLYLRLSAPCQLPEPNEFGSSPACTPPAQTTLGCSSQHKASWEGEFKELEVEIKLRNYSPKTFDSYRFWVAQFQAFVRSRPTAKLSNQEVRGFLSFLAVQRGVSASSQNQAFNALLFFFRHVLHRDFGKIDGVIRAKRHRYIPVVLSRAEVEAVLAHLKDPYRLVVLLLYGSGLRLAECANLRIHCFNLDAMLLTVHDGKGQKDRTVPLLARALPEIQEQIEKVRRLHAQDLANGYAGVFLPHLLDKKFKNAARQFIWQCLFPAATLTFVPGSREMRRYHLHESHIQGAVREAVARVGIPKRVSPHTFRHTYASHLLLADHDLQTIQRLLGHADIKTTMIYLQTVPSLTLKTAKSPLDCT